MSKANLVKSRLQRYLNYIHHSFRPSTRIHQPPVTFTNKGFCYSCNQATRFTARYDWWRDHYVCENCRSVPRERAVMYCIEKFFPNWRESIIHESSPVGRGTSLRLKNEASNYFATQYFPGGAPGQMHIGFRNENLEQLTFENESIDLHVTQDVFEHIFNPAQAFREIARTLKPGGAHIFTTPLVNKTSPQNGARDWT